jgi:hypothetical protein
MVKPSRLPEARRREGGVFIDPEELRRFFLDLRKADPVLAREFRRAIRDSGQRVQAKVRAGAERVSTDTGRIPAAVRVSTSFRPRRAAISITISSRRAPEARPLEALGITKVFRHPVFGNRSIWVRQTSRPFFFGSATDSDLRYMELQVALALDKAARAAGFTD